MGSNDYCVLGSSSVCGQMDRDTCSKVPQLPDFSQLCEECAEVEEEFGKRLLWLLLLILVALVVLIAMKKYILPKITWPLTSSPDQDPDIVQGEGSSEESQPLKAVKSQPEQSGAAALSLDSIPGKVSTEEETKVSGDQAQR